MNIPATVVSISLAAILSSSATASECTDCQTSWIFKPGTFTHDPMTGARVAQYVKKPPVEPLPDPRNVTSRYRRTRTNIRGADGSLDTHYQVEAWGNGRGGIDAEWERFHNAWQNSFLTGSTYGNGYPPGVGGGFPGNGYGFPPNGYGYGQPAYGYGQPAYGYGGYPPQAHPHHHHRRHYGNSDQENEE